eukprot:TRINITY_DN6317_c0_g1_i7.p1 TRINITY_DN6317_c0_g1~~TRINITY_DN6317_c0_g1_i7.p1  ORF type:complete len:315 (-),score=57.63 TRINITY_DN6317_c0_g1_i7:99-1043(-)
MCIRDSFLSSMHEGNVITLPEDRRLLFKHVDANNLAILTRGQANTEAQEVYINLVILNTFSGRVIYSAKQEYVSSQHPINLLFDENSVFVTYFNTRSLQNEIWAVEFYRNHVENSFQQMLSTYFEEGYKDNLEEFYFQKELPIVTFQQKFAFPYGIKKIILANTLRKVTRRNLLVITERNQIYSLDRNLISTRRPITIDGKVVPNKDSFESAELLPYKYNIPVNSINFITYSHELSEIRFAKLSPTKLESTALMLAYGDDLFFNKVTPDRIYDSLDESFNYLMIAGAVVVVIIGTIFMKSLAKKSKVHKIFYTT